MTLHTKHNYNLQIPSLNATTAGMEVMEGREDIKQEDFKAVMETVALMNKVVNNVHIALPPSRG